MPPKSPDARPVILALHGGGSNATVFTVQCRRLIWGLKDHFRFIFPQASIPSDPGHGMLPVFESVAPFYRWVSRTYPPLGSMSQEEAEAKGLISRVEIVPEEDRTKFEDAMTDFVTQEAGGWVNVVGVIGFSLGARMGAGMLLRQIMEARNGRDSTASRSPWNLKFAVIIGGGNVPLALTDDVTEEDHKLLSEMPTVIACGRNDPLRPGSVEMSKACWGDKSWWLEFDGGHHLPLTEPEATELCRLIKIAYQSGGGTLAEVGH